MYDGGTKRSRIARIYESLQANCPLILFRRFLTARLVSKMKLMLCYIKVDAVPYLRYHHAEPLVGLYAAAVSLLILGM